MVHLSPTTVFDVQTLAAYVIFLASYLVFALGKFPGLKIDRAGAAIIGAVGMVAFRIVQPADALRFIDFPTLVLLFSMMLIVGNLHLVGFFEWNAEMVLRRLKPSTCSLSMAKRCLRSTVPVRRTTFSEPGISATTPSRTTCMVPR